MKIKITALCAAVAVAGALATACDPAPKATNAPASNNAAKPANSNDSVKIDKNVREQPGPDNSQIVVRTMPNGAEVSVRKWDAGPIKRVKRGTRAVRVVYRDGKIYRTEDKEMMDHALDWTTAQIDAAIKKTGKLVDQPAASKAGGDDDDGGDE